MDQPRLGKLCNHRFPEPLDVHGRSTRKVLDPAAHLSIATGVSTPHGHLTLGTRHQRSADGALGRHLEWTLRAVALLAQHLHDGGDHIAGLLDHYPIADPQIFSKDLLLVVKRRP